MISERILRGCAGDYALKKVKFMYPKDEIVNKHNLNKVKYEQMSEYTPDQWKELGIISRDDFMKDFDKYVWEEYKRLNHIN